jgi:hypothetical protein
LKFLLEVSAEDRAEQALYQLQATLGAVAPGALKDGAKILERTRASLERQAGIK